MEKQTMKQKAQTYWEKHKNKLIVTTGVIVVTVASVLGIEYYLNHPSLKRMLEKTSTKELEEKRNSIHNEYLSYTENDEYRSGLWNLITIIDREIRSRYEPSQDSISHTYHREHGYNLYKPD